eukprot:14673068-Alexandrium_andersonii.AAC.1
MASVRWSGAPGVAPSYTNAWKTEPKKRPEAPKSSTCVMSGPTVNRSTPRSRSQSGCRLGIGC